MAKPKPRRRILVVDDNVDFAQLLVFVLRDEGYEVEYAVNGNVAVEAARTFRPDVVFLDIGLPGIDGFEVCRRLKREAGLEKTVIIAVTGYGTEEHREQARAAGCHMHLIKPVDPKRIISIIESL